MEISLPIGTRGTFLEFMKSYNMEFLKKHGLDEIRLSGHILPNSMFIVPTKYGLVIVNIHDTLTYLGHKKWDVRLEKENAD